MLDSIVVRTHCCKASGLWRVPKHLSNIIYIYICIVASQDVKFHVQSYKYIYIYNVLVIRLNYHVDSSDYTLYKCITVSTGINMYTVYQQQICWIVCICLGKIIIFHQPRFSWHSRGPISLPKRYLLGEIGCVSVLHRPPWTNLKMFPPLSALWPNLSGVRPGWKQGALGSESDGFADVVWGIYIYSALVISFYNILHIFLGHLYILMISIYI